MSAPSPRRRISLALLALSAGAFTLASAAEPDAPEPSPTASAVASPTESMPATPAPTLEPPVETPTPAPTPRPAGLGEPILFRGECTPGGGAGGCRIVAAAIVAGDSLRPIRCDSEGETRRKIADRYFASGHALDLYVRGAPAGSFVIADADEPPRGCSNRARGRKVQSPGKVLSFVALDPEDPVKLAASRFPAGVQPEARPVAVAALKAEPFLAQPFEVGVHEVRRLVDGKASVLVVEASIPRGRVVLIAEGEGSDPAAWRVVWASEADAEVILVDTFDLGADQRPEVFLERLHRGEPSEFLLLRRDDSGWKPVEPAG